MRIENYYFRQEAVSRQKSMPRGKTFAEEMEDTEKNTMDVKASGKDRKSDSVPDTKSKTVSEIVVKPDGSRVLMVTISIGGMETNMSLKISEPSSMDNDNKNGIENVISDESEMNETWNVQE